MSTLAEALAPRSDQLNADDLIPGPRILKITDARISKEERQTKIVINFEGDQGKPWKPCKTMGRAMVMAWAIADEKQMIGKSVRVYRDPEVKFGDQGAIGGIRISHMSHLEKAVTMKLTVSQGKKGQFTFHPLVTEAADPKHEGPSRFLSLIADCKTKAELNAFWKEFGETVPDAAYDEVLAAFEARMAVLKRPQPAADELEVVEAEPRNTAGEAAAPANGVLEKMRAVAKDARPETVEFEEGPADEDRGEQPTLADALADIRSCEIVADINPRVATYEQQLPGEDMLVLRGAAMDRLAELKG